MARRVLTVLLALAVGAVAGFAAVGAKGGEPISIGSYRTIQSKVLNEGRTLLVHLPRGYDGGTASCPVVYMLYGDHVTTYFAEAVSVVDKLGPTGRIPDCILVGIMNTDRYRDLLPEHDGRPTGIADFSRFPSAELFPLVENAGCEGFRLVLEEVHANDEFLPPLGLKQGLKALFANYPFPRELEVDSLDDVVAHYRKLSAHYGFEVDLPPHVPAARADSLTKRGKSEEMLAVLRCMPGKGPASPDALWRLGNHHERSGELQEAVEYYERMIPQMGSDAGMIRNRVEQLRQRP